MHFGDAAQSLDDGPELNVDLVLILGAQGLTLHDQYVEHLQSTYFLFELGRIVGHLTQDADEMGQEEVRAQSLSSQVY